MTTYLVQLAFGPVQGFIATARRSRDLWFGSYILSEISKAAACSLAKDSRAKLIFPAPKDIAKDLDPWSGFAVANVVIAELPDSDLGKAKQAIDRAKGAAADRWRELCEEARRLIADEHGRSAGASGQRATAIAFVRDDIWKAQLDDVVEMFCGMVPLGACYDEANKRLRALVANRKNTRDFQPYRDTFKRPKSSLDGAQSTVIAEPNHEAANETETLGRIRRRLGIEPNEQLDTAGMVKRVVGRRRGFLPVARVAAAPWLELAEQENKEGFDELKKSFTELESLDLATGLNDFRYLNYGWVEHFPYDGQLLYPERIDVEHARAVRELQQRNAATRQADIDKLNTAIDRLRSRLKPLLQRLGTPCPYYGLLLADGDKMGKLIGAAAKDDAEAHRRISRALAEFAGQVSKVMNDHGGACIYSGGDDVLGLVALPDAVCCGFALAEAFRRQLRGVAETYGESPTLSVGIAIAHMLEPLGDVRELASAAEKLAKGKTLQAREQGNALGLVLKPRGGAEYRCRIRWDDDDSLAFLGAYQKYFSEGVLPRGLPHELDALWQRAADVFDGNRQHEQFAGLWGSMLVTALKKKRETGGDEGVADNLRQELIRELAPDNKGCDAVRARLDLLRAALWLSGRIDAAAG